MPVFEPGTTQASGGRYPCGWRKKKERQEKQYAQTHIETNKINTLSLEPRVCDHTVIIHLNPHHRQLLFGWRHRLWRCDKHLQPVRVCVYICVCLCRQMGAIVYNRKRHQTLCKSIAHTITIMNKNNNKRSQKNSNNNDDNNIVHQYSMHTAVEGKRDSLIGSFTFFSCFAPSSSSASGLAA